MAVPQESGRAFEAKATKNGVNGATTKSSSGPPDEPESPPEPSPAGDGRPSRVVGLLAAVGFSIAMWVFIAMAVLGLVLKVMR